MEINKLKTAFAESAALMQEVLRGAVRAGLLAAMEAEVEELCGRKYHPDQGSDYRRAGSETGKRLSQRHAGACQTPSGASSQLKSPLLG